MKEPPLPTHIDANGSARFDALTAPECVVGDIEPNDTLTTAQAVVLTDNLWIPGSIEPIGDFDWFQVSLTAGDRVWAYLYTQQSAGQDSQIYLTDPLSDTVQFDDDTGSQGSLSSAIAGAPITQTGTFYLKVQEFGNNGLIDPYQFLV
ncbi:MAG TPA: PPC domain-containing protein, partial [Chloroflexia bacterium]|nr:PPC domain-containing protein [Chloroflexia bacterium]